MAITTINRLISALDAIDWEQPMEAANEQAAEILRLQWENRRELLRGLADFIEGMKFPFPVMTVTGELVSSLLHCADKYVLKLNEFREHSTVGFRSEGLHNHTRPIITLGLEGYYEQNFYTPPKDPEDYIDGESFDLSQFTMVEGPKMHPGVVNVLHPDIIHGLTDFRHKTKTLCLYPPIVWDTITVFNTVSGKVNRRVTTCNRVGEMAGELRDLAAQSDESRAPSSTSAFPMPC